MLKNGFPNREAPFTVTASGVVAANEPWTLSMYHLAIQRENAATAERDAALVEAAPDAGAVASGNEVVVVVPTPVDVVTRQALWLGYHQ